MRWFFDIIRQTFHAMVSREPTIRFGGHGDTDWLPPVVGGPGLRPGSWPHEAMSGMADGSGAWYFDRH